MGGSGGIGWGVCRGHAGGDGAEWGDARSGGEYAGGGAGAAGYPAEGHQPDRVGRGHCFVTEGYTGNEDASDRAEYVAVGSGGGEVLAHLQTLRGRFA